jgi:glycerol kinase
MEEEPDDLVESCLECIEKAVEMLEEKGDYKVGDIKGMGITNQRGE